jgi:hypothetical protein
MKTHVFVAPTLFLVFLSAVACKETNTPNTNGTAGQTANPVDSGSPDQTKTGSEGDAANEKPKSDSGTSIANDGSIVGKPDAGKNTGASGAAGAVAGIGGTAGVASGGRGGAGGTGGAAGAAVESTDCCTAHTSSGCDDKTIEKCICEMLPDCCSKGWTKPCVLLTEGHYCEPTVRECVCGPEADGGWAQSNCCAQEWTNFCETVAVQKCKATTICSN